jgi:hypothetical protein
MTTSQSVRNNSTYIHDASSEIHTKICAGLINKIKNRGESEEEKSEKPHRVGSVNDGRERDKSEKAHRMRGVKYG